MDLIDVDPQLNLYHADWPTYTLWHNDLPATVLNEDGEDGRRADVQTVARARDGGERRAGAPPILSNRVYVNEHSDLGCIIMRGAQIGRGCKLRRCIIDKGTRPRRDGHRLRPRRGRAPVHRVRDRHHRGRADHRWD